jgi:hypothetical protein
MEDRMDKPRIFLGSSAQQKKLLQAITRGLEEVAHVDGRDDQRRAELIAERLAEWKSTANA